MKKIIKRIGDSVGVIFNKEDVEVYNLHIGDVIDLKEIVKVKREKK
jgi:hypothetical protein